MNKKEVTEIRKQFSQTNCNITRIAGCYVDYEKEKKMQTNRVPYGYPQAPAQMPPYGTQVLPYNTMYAQPQHPMGMLGAPYAYPGHPDFVEGCPHTCPHYTRKRHRHRRHHHKARSSAFARALAWLRDLFSSLCCGWGQYHCAQEMSETPWLWSPAEQRLAYLQRSRDMRGDQHFSPRFLAETRAARKHSRLNLDALKNTNYGILSSQSLESLELELLERSVRRRRHQAIPGANWSTSQPVLYYGSNAHNSEEQMLQELKKRSKSTPSLFMEK